MSTLERPLELVVITGGTGAEHDVSLASAASAVEHLDSSRYRVTVLVIGRDGLWYDGHRTSRSVVEVVRILNGADVAFPLIHGRTGEDGALAALLDLAGVRYVGSGLHAGTVGMDKHLTKLLAADAGLSVAPGQLIGDGTAPDMTELKPPLFVKPNGEGSSYGVTRVTDHDDLSGAIEAASRFDSMVLVEEQVHGREIDIAVLTQPDGELRISPPLEVVVGEAGGFFDTTSKYDGGANFLVPAPVSASQLRRLRSWAARLYRLLGCAGVARFDFFLTPEDTLVLNEVNTMPGLTSASQVPRMFAADGLPYAKLLDLLIEAALDGGEGSA